MSELNLDQLSAIFGGRKTNLACFISESDVGASKQKKWTKCQSKSQSKGVIKDLRPSHCTSTLVTNVFPMGEW